MKENKLIAEFMGVNVITIDDVRKNKNPYISSADGHLENDLKYYSSWDWLMPVVKKIYGIDSEADFFGSINREGTYKEVVEFINEYNKTNDKG
ncbi:MAG: hypothetical protein CMJ25_30875 [Phycisphaerae bacterium]|nr:hypothetical protein [Phycisphaerae bacterium]|tara:strand:+ start:1496 stop:1774 length:279 start_codon:yes stop_codon:yes gene_type:complete